MRAFVEATWYTTPMHKACYNDDVDGLRALVESLSKSEAETLICQRDHHGWTALHVAVFMNHIEIINILVSFSVGLQCIRIEINYIVYICLLTFNMHVVLKIRSGELHSITQPITVALKP